MKGLKPQRFFGRYERVKQWRFFGRYERVKTMAFFLDMCERFKPTTAFFCRYERGKLW
jgi:hypothetical protein